MEHPVVPARITIDFRDSIDPHRAWILGVGDPGSRVELLAFDTATSASGSDLQVDPLARLVPVRALDGDCTCPEYCERDHANE